MTFTGSANDPDGDAVTFQWNFGDGASGTGPTVSHVFGSSGTFTVTLTVSDAQGGAGTATGTVTVRTLTGRWRGDFACAPVYDFQQAGSSLTGQVHLYSCRKPGSSPLVGGVVTNPTNVSFSYYGIRGRGDFHGIADQSLNTITVVGGGYTLIRE